MSLTQEDLLLLEKLLDKKFDEKLAPYATREEIDAKLDERFSQFALELEQKFATREELVAMFDEKLAAYATREELFEILQAISDKMNERDKEMAKVKHVLTTKLNVAF